MFTISVILMSCGPSAAEIENQIRLNKNISEVDSRTKVYNQEITDVIIQTICYYHDETTDIYYSVVYINDGQIDMEIIPSNMVTSKVMNNSRKFKSR